MIAWRLATTLYPPLTGEGARKRGGRWNSPGVPLVYASEHLSLAVLELLVHLESDDLPANLAAVRIDIPGSDIESSPGVPRSWFDDPLRRQSRRYGDTWAAEQRSLALSVPSAVIPYELNLLLNPLHPDFSQVDILDQEPFELDRRLRY